MNMFAKKIPYKSIIMRCDHINESVFTEVTEHFSIIKYNSDMKSVCFLCLKETGKSTVELAVNSIMKYQGGIFMKQKILVVEDDFTIQTQLKTLLAGNGYEVSTVSGFEKIIEQAKTFKPHLMLLDIKLPGNSGFEICSQIRAFSDIPIVFVTSSNKDMDELNSIMLGGDAFITKPYNTAILLAKIASLLRRAQVSEEKEFFSWNGATLHLESSLIEYKGQKAELTKNEVKILYYLFKNAGKICSRNDIVDFLWDNQLYVDDNALSVNITRIREKLAAVGLTDFIKTKHRQGYTL